jgi:hypothetical protein
MRIVKHQEFLTLPSGTFFSYHGSIKGTESTGTGLCIKFNSLHGNGRRNIDFIYLEVTGDQIIPSDGSDCGSGAELEMLIGRSVPADFTGTKRDGLFDSDALYLIYEKDDMLRMVEKIKEYL